MPGLLIGLTSKRSKTVTITWWSAISSGQGRYTYYLFSYGQKNVAVWQPVRNALTGCFLINRRWIALD
jgi:hypothetical protein